jgi:hypothetical protein
MQFYITCIYSSKFVIISTYLWMQISKLKKISLVQYSCGFHKPTKQYTLVILGNFKNINTIWNLDCLHTIKLTNALMSKLHFLHTLCHNSNMFRSILIYCDLSWSWVPSWLPKHELDILLIWTMAKTYKTTTSTTYGPFLHYYKLIL